MASKTSAMDALQALEELGKGTPAPVYLVWGPERFLLESVLRELARLVLAGVDDDLAGLNRQKFDDDAQLSQVIAAAQQLPMFAPRRLVIARADQWLAPGARRLPDGEIKALEIYLSNPVATTTLVFYCEQVDRRLRPVKALEEAAVVIQCKPLSPHQAPAWLMEKAKAAGARLRPAAAQLLVSLVGTDLQRLTTELDKALAYAGDDRVVDEDHIAQVVTGSAPVKIFDLLDAVAQRDAGTALKELSRLLDKGEPPLLVLAMLTRQARSLLQVHWLVQRGYSRADIQKHLKLHSFVVQKLHRQVRHWSGEDATAALLACVDAETAIKTGRLAPEAGLELLVTRLAGRLT